ncbi:MAG TPA: hypothetical protein VHW24_10465 [Bryobacteraceae bacterium]|jgi:hypothetical protein|nr:hypothetical protein [Bryobacteraceae bacterium]
MIEAKLIVGRFINLPNAVVMPPGLVLGAVGSFQLVGLQTCHIQESTGVFTKTSGIQAGAGAKAHRNFRFLPWLSGRISEVDLVGSDVLTGPMSGCWLISYRKPNGVPHAAHLGTDVASPVGTAAVNNTWNNYAIANPGNVIGGFNPLRHWNGALPVGRPGENGTPRFFGLFTTAGQYYTIVTFQQLANTALLRIAGVQLTPTVTVARLQQVDQPGA